MKQTLWHYPNSVNVPIVEKQRKRAARTVVSIVIINPKGCVYPVFFEVDEGYPTRRNEIDPDDLTDYGYWHRNQPKKSWTPPGYGDDD